MIESRSAVDVLTDAIWRQTDIGLDVMRRAVDRALHDLRRDDQPYLVIDLALRRAWWTPSATPLRGIHAQRQPFGSERAKLMDWLMLAGIDPTDVVAFGFLGDGGLRVETVIRGAHGKILVAAGTGLCTRVRDIPLVEPFPAGLTPWLHALMLRDPDPEETTP